MKKLVLFLVAVSVILSLCGCSVKNTEPKNDDSAVSSGADGDKTEEKIISDAKARELFDRNLNCTLEIFDLKTLEYGETAVKDTLFPVTDDRFKSFADLEKYVKSTYVEDVANRLLYEPRFEDHKLYQDVDGVFCIDTAVIGGKGYYVDWENYGLEVANSGSDECELKVTASIEEPSDNPKKEPYKKTATVKSVDGKWLLTEVVY